MEIAFTHPEYLWLFLIIPLLIIFHLFTLKRRRNLALRFSNFEALEKVSKGALLAKPYKGSLLNKNLFLLLIRAIVYSLLVLAISGTAFQYYGKATDYDYVLAIDSSASMLADDFKPNRLGAAKESALLFVDSIHGKSNIGVVSFAGTVSIDSNPISKIRDVKDVIGSIRVKEIGGTDIGDALITATNLFEGDNKKIIILLTDGQSNVGTTPEEALSYVKSKEVVVYTMGVATKAGGGLQNIGFVSELDEDSLKNIAEETGGNYFKAGDKDVLDRAFAEIALASEKKLSIELSWIFFIAALVLLSMEWFLVSVRYKTIP